MRGAPIVRLNHLGGLAGLGQATGFTEEALISLQAEVDQTRAEREYVEAQIQAVRTGRPMPSRRPIVAPGHAAPPAASALPGGTVNIPILGNVPVLAVGAAALLLLRRMRK